MNDSLGRRGLVRERAEKENAHGGRFLSEREWDSLVESYCGSVASAGHVRALGALRFRWW